MKKLQNFNTFISNNKNKNKLFSIIGHDLRGSQGTTLGVLGLIEDDELDAAEQKKYIKTIIAFATKILEFVIGDIIIDSNPFFYFHYN